MTKPITAVAALIAVGGGRLRAQRPGPHVHPVVRGRRGCGAAARRCARRPSRSPRRCAIWHLFTHTSGLTYGFMQAHPVDALYRQAGFEWGVPDGLDLAGVCDRLAELPLLFQPGTEWNYGMSTDVLGMVVEVGGRRAVRRLRPAARARPAGHERDDVVRPRRAGRPPRRAVRADAGDAARRCATTRWAPARSTPPAATLGGGGLCSTAGDYLRFAEMLRRRGELDGVRLLAPGTVDYMATNHLPGGADLTAFGRPLFSETTFDGVGFGLGVSVTVDPVKAKVPGSVGDFGWGGAASTAFWVDPVHDLVVRVHDPAAAERLAPAAQPAPPAGQRRPGRLSVRRRTSGR